MSQQLMNRNDDISRLVKKGYALAFDKNHYIVVRDIPYINAAGSLAIGAIVTKFIDVGDDRIVQDDHQIFFAGSAPYGLDGRPIPNLGGGAVTLALSDASPDVRVERSFSNKPTSGKFVDFFEKIESYVRIIAGPAIERFSKSPLTYRVVDSGEFNSPFKVRDTMISRAEIGDLAEQFKDDCVAIIGLGGTGGYLLDLIVKTPVREIRAFDMDFFYTHNTFRSPGEFKADEIGKRKTEVYRSRYESFRKGLTFVEKFVDESCAEDFRGVTFAFVCVDKGSSRAGIIRLLISLGIPFIDVGMGLDRKRGPLNGMLRTTYFPPERAREMVEKQYVPFNDGHDDLYRTNIQIGEMNAINACMAVIRFKQLRGFYFEKAPHLQLLMRVGNFKVSVDAETPED